MVLQSSFKIKFVTILVLSPLCFDVAIKEKLSLCDITTKQKKYRMEFVRYRHILLLENIGCKWICYNTGLLKTWNYNVFLGNNQLSICWHVWPGLFNSVVQVSQFDELGVFWLRWYANACLTPTPWRTFTAKPGVLRCQRRQGKPAKVSKPLTGLNRKYIVEPTVL